MKTISVFQALVALIFLQHSLSGVAALFRQIEQQGFTYDNCGSNNDPIVVKSLLIEPDPISFPGLMRVTLDANISRELSGPISVLNKS